LKKMEVKEHKKLVLKNILRREVRGITSDDFNRELLMFHKFIERERVQTFGPLVIVTLGTQVLGDAITQDFDLIIQAHNYKKYSLQAQISERFECSNCIYIKFEGHPKDLHYAYSKLDLFLYENELESDGKTYSIVLEETGNYTTIDIFLPVKST